MKRYLFTGSWAEAYNTERGGEILLFREDRGTYRLAGKTETGKSVSAIVWDGSKKLLFAVCETNYHLDRRAGGEIRVYRMKGSTGSEELHLEGIFNSYGAFPIGLELLDDKMVILNHGSNLAKVCRTYIDEAGQVRTVFDGDEANLVLLKRRPDGMPGDVLDLVRFSGCGEIPFFQESPSPHELFHDGCGFLIPVRGPDRAELFTLGESGGFRKNGYLCTPSGYGPRNIAVYQDFVYVLCEIEPCICVFKKSGTAYESIQNIMTADRGAIPSCPSWSMEYPHPAGILVHSGLKKLYAVTRGLNVLTVYDMEESGLLSRRCVYTLHGQNPRQLLKTETGLLVLCQDTGNIFRIKLDSSGLPLGQEEIISSIERLAVMSRIEGVN